MKSSITFLSGLPRTGSTLLTSILSQNPAIHTEGNSALCQLMWDMQLSCLNTEQMQNKPEIASSLICSIPETFYAKAQGHIIDKCRSWTLPANLDLIDRYITKSPKIIVMLRPIIDVVKSFVYIRTLNNWQNPENGLLQEGSEPIMRSFEGVKNAKVNDRGQFLFIWYDDFIDNSKNTINEIYDFCGWKKFEHNFNNIINKNVEKDNFLGMLGLHDIRPEISRRKFKVELSNELFEKAVFMDKQLLSIGLK